MWPFAAICVLMALLAAFDKHYKRVEKAYLIAVWTFWFLVFTVGVHLRFR